MRATLTAKTIRHYDENGYVAYLEVVGGVEGGKLSRISSIGDRQYKNLSAICDRELFRVGLAVDVVGIVRRGIKAGRLRSQIITELRKANPAIDFEWADDFISTQEKEMRKQGTLSSLSAR